MVYVSDSRNNRVRRITAAGTLQTVAGSDTPGDAGDGGLATEASLSQPNRLEYGRKLSQKLYSLVPQAPQSVA